jgi:hypothetical protein
VPGAGNAPGSQVALDFTGNWAPPAGWRVGLEFGTATVEKPDARSVFPEGGDAHAFGTAETLNRNRYYEIDGLDAIGLGLPGIRNFHLFFRLDGDGIPPRLKLGMPAVKNRRRFVKPHGIKPLPLAHPGVRDRRQSAIPSGLAPTTFGTLYAEAKLDTLDFEGGWETPTGEQVGLEFGRVKEKTDGRAVFPNTLDTLVFGNAEVANRNRYYAIDGLDGATLGEAVVWNFHGFIDPAGIASRVRFGSPTLQRLARSIRPNGLAPTIFGNPVLDNDTHIAHPPGIEPEGAGQPYVWNLWQFVTAGVGSGGAVFGRPAIENTLQLVYPAGILKAAAGSPVLTHRERGLYPVGPMLLGIGLPWASHSPRTVTPAGILTLTFPKPSVNPTRWLEPEGFEATGWGSRIVPEGRPVYPAGFEGVVPMPDVWHYDQFVLPVGLPATTHGTGRIWNRLQFVAPVYFEEDGLHGDFWGSWTRIENRTRVLGPQGIAPPYAYYHLVSLTGRPLYPVGVAPLWPPTAWERGNLVTHGVRTYPLPGIAPLEPSPWATVWNAAKPLKPGGIAASKFGVASVVNTRRIFTRISLGAQSGYGKPMVADRIRTLTVEELWSISAPLVRGPQVHLHSRWLTPEGQRYMVFGTPYVVIHRNIVHPRWTAQGGDFGATTEVRNLTPELYVRGRRNDEFGAPFVRLEWRPVSPLGSLMTIFGAAHIADTRRWIKSDGIPPGAVGEHDAFREGPDLPSTRFIVHSHPTSPTITPVAGPAFGYPDLLIRAVYPEGFSRTRWGAAHVFVGRLRPFGISQIPFDNPTVSLKVRFLEPESINLNATPTNPRISPWYIFGPPQVVPGRPLSVNTPHVVNGHDSVQYPAVWDKQNYIGAPRPVVANRNRVVAAYGYPHGDLGKPRLDLHRRYINPNPISSLRFGPVWATGGDLEIDVDRRAPSLCTFGAHTVSAPYTGPQIIHAFSTAGEFGRPAVEHFHRQIFPSGAAALAMGRSEKNYYEYHPQSLCVHPPMPTRPAGVDSSRVGEHWVSFWVRELIVEGIDAFESEYDFYNFSGRMKVWRYGGGTADTSWWYRQTLRVEGLDALGMGTPNLRNTRHYILPDGNMDNFRKGVLT